jgi:hypothetical protein
VVLLIAGGLSLLVGGGATGWALARSQQRGAVTAEALAELQAGQAALVEQASRPIVLDAELRASLAKTPPACLPDLGGDPMSAQCLLQTCWQYGQSDAQRPDCDAAEALVVAELSQKGRSESE